MKIFIYGYNNSRLNIQNFVREKEYLEIIF